jgi:proteasome lid subunit RPN8/RPN11
VTHGEVEPDDVKVYIHQNTYNAIERFSRSDMDHELGSILFGGYSQYSSKMHVVISDHIEAKYTDATASTLTFTHETWDYIHKEHATRYPNLKILGWQHTHPGYGIFLSNYDVFIQENFFNLPFQVAYVVDPKQNLRGFFQWKSGKIEKLKGYYVYDEVGKEIILNKHTANRKVINGGENPSTNIPKTYIIAGALFLITALIGGVISIGQLQSRLNEQTSRQQELETMIASQDQRIVNTNDALQSLQKAIVDKPIDTVTLKKIEEIIKKAESQQNQINDQTKIITELRELVKADTSTQLVVDNPVVFSYYTVQSGDTLAGICSELGIDYSANLSVITAVNGLDNVNKIDAGKILYLPVPVK